MMQGTQAIYFTVLNRPLLLLGVDRQLFFLLVGLCVPIAFADGFGWMMDLIAIGFGAVGYVIGLLLTRVDAQILVLYRRHIRFQNYYAPLAGIAAPIPMVRPSVPIYHGQRGIV